MSWSVLAPYGLDTEETRAAVRLAVVAAGGIVREVLGFQGGASSLKDDDQRVTDADRLADRWLTTTLQEILPGSGGYSEESQGFGPADATVFWLIDPLDGTRASTHGGLFAISVAAVALDAGRPVALAGWVYLPTAGFLYEAVISRQGGECRRNGRPAALQSCVNDAYLFVNSDWRADLIPTWRGKVTAPGATAAHLALLVEPGGDAVGVALTRYRSYDAAAGLAVSLAGGASVRPIAPPGAAPLTFDGIMEILAGYVACPGDRGPDLVVGPAGDPRLFPRS